MGLISMLKNLFGGEETAAAEVRSTATANEAPAAMQVALPMTEEEKTEVAIISAVIAGQHHPGAKFHVNSITRIE